MSDSFIKFYNKFLERWPETPEVERERQVGTVLEGNRGFRFSRVDDDHAGSFYVPSV